MSSLLRALFNGTSKHKKLSEEWATIREPVVEGVTFYCKYLGSTLVDDPKGEASTAEAIKRIIHAAKQVSRKPERVGLHVSLEGIRMADTSTNEVLLYTSIYKISYCSADAHYDHVFAFIATNDNDTCECHAFLCSKRKIAQAVTVSIAQAFNLAYEYWKMAVENRENGDVYAHEELPAEVKVGSASIQNGGLNVHSQPSSQTSSPIPIRSDFGSSDMSTSGYQSSTQALLIDLEGFSEQLASTETSKDNQVESNSSGTVLSKPWDAFGDFDEINDGFERLALRREDQNRLPGISPERWVDLDLTVLTDLPPASPTGSGFWQLASSPPSSSTASSPTDPWLLGQSPPDVWEDFSGSPNMAFLHSCQSPPSQLMFANSSVKNTLVPYEVAKDPFIPCKVGKDPIVPSTSENSFSSKMVEKSVHCGTIKNPFSPSGSVKNPFSLKHILEDPFTCARNPFSASQPEKSSISSCSISGCSSGQPLWGNDAFDGQKGKNVLCS
ncbi:low density lipoprotein receptor adapter protein 1-A [Procambarus clarkii]|uniref:low density lipoprotein receptor adapter protein 1-A n=1 Tax=Procambarus clarkii TaxID=6728 RepID=UPI001E67198C|nr:low density lipoprotein receptor adapter protein 1-A-like [Procambarus clarkii]